VQVLYELLLYRARERRGEEGEEGDVTGFLYDVDDNGTREPASVSSHDEDMIVWLLIFVLSRSCFGR
jgi:hypothetical protein